MSRHTPPVTYGPLFAPPPGPRDGDTFTPADEPRLNAQAARVFEAVRDGKWRTLADIAALTGAPEASVSARLRDLRKERFGSHDVERRRVAGVDGLFEYRVTKGEQHAD